MFIPGCVISDGPDSTITIYNDSDYAIFELYIAERNTFDWGPDLLRGLPLEPGDAITVEVDCGTYDVEVWDELGTDCVLEGIDVCFEDDGWSITNTDLAICDAFGFQKTGTKKTSEPASESVAE